ncbi:MAG: type II toxin-antitoxin system RelE/ParE family toxin [Proteobacteria bacterium]|nr:type II toxin-antitoxin system RelE/ParE family toxin [Pseudomonadota bacterium]
MASKSGWTVGYANEAVRKEMWQQPKLVQSRFDKIRARIQDNGLDAISPKYKEKVEDDIWELRWRGKDTIVRSLYLQWVGKRVIILVVFTKKTPKIPKHILQLARRRAKEVRNA